MKISFVLAGFTLAITAFATFLPADNVVGNQALEANVRRVNGAPGLEVGNKARDNEDTAKVDITCCFPQGPCGQCSQQLSEACNKSRNKGQCQSNICANQRNCKGCSVCNRGGAAAIAPVENGPEERALPVPVATTSQADSDNALKERSPDSEFATCRICEYKLRKCKGNKSCIKNVCDHDGFECQGCRVCRVSPEPVGRALEDRNVNE